MGPPRVLMTRRGLAALALGLAPALALGWGRRSPAQAAPESRQVTLFGVLATPGGRTVDPKLVKVEPQLRKLFPGYGFRLLGHETRRLSPMQSVACRLGEGYVAEAQLANVLDGMGRVQLRFALEHDGQVDFATAVTTPPNQLFFCDKVFPNGERLLIGIGAR